MNKEIFTLFPPGTDNNELHTQSQQHTNGNKRFEQITILTKNDKQTHTDKAQVETETYNNINWFEKVPSFKQFVQYVTDVDASGSDFGVSKYRFVNHWLPYYMTCNPCYQGIGNYKLIQLH